MYEIPPNKACSGRAYALPYLWCSYEKQRVQRALSALIARRKRKPLGLTLSATAWLLWRNYCLRVEMRNYILFAVLSLLIAVGSVLYAQSRYDAQCMRLGFYGAYLTVDGVFCKRQVGTQLVVYKSLDDCIQERLVWERKQIKPKLQRMEG
jgi:hypothetical protein